MRSEGGAAGTLAARFPERESGKFSTRGLPDRRCARRGIPSARGRDRLPGALESERVAEELHRIMGHVFDPHFEMQVRPGRSTGTAHLGNLVALVDDVARPDEELASMGVACQQ